MVGGAIRIRTLKEAFKGSIWKFPKRYPGGPDAPGLGTGAMAPLRPLVLKDHSGMANINLMRMYLAPSYESSSKQALSLAAKNFFINNFTNMRGVNSILTL